jgi:hypothetical protein
MKTQDEEKSPSATLGTTILAGLSQIPPAAGKPR